MGLGNRDHGFQVKDSEGSGFRSMPQEPGLLGFRVQEPDFEHVKRGCSRLQKEVYRFFGVSEYDSGCGGPYN